MASIVDALKGKPSPIAHLPWRYLCGCCGNEDFGGGYPLTSRCVQCGECVEADNNPEYVRPSALTLQVPTCSAL